MWPIEDESEYTQDQYTTVSDVSLALSLVLQHRLLRKTFARWKTLTEEPRLVFDGLEGHSK